MLKTVDLKRYEIKHGIDYKLENGVCLFGEDWNGEYYPAGAIVKTNCLEFTGRDYFPVYGEKGNIVGFEEM